MHHIQCTVKENKNMNILFLFKQGTCVECKPTPIACSFETSLLEAWELQWFNRRGRSTPDIFGMKINGESLTLFNIIGAIRHAH